MQEIDRILTIIARTENKADKARLMEANEIISQKFGGTILTLPDRIMGRDASPLSFKDVKEALQFIAEHAEKVGVEFDCPSTEAEIHRYILKYGLEILKNREYQWDLKTPVDEGQ